METKNIIKWWNFPSATIINKNLPKTQIYPYIKKVEDKKLLQDSVQSIYILANIQTNNTHIEVYEDNKELYQEIQFFYVKMKKKDESKKVYKLLAHLIPYPLVVLIDESKNFSIYTGRFEKLSNGFLKLVSIYASPFYKADDLKEVLKQLSLADFPKNNMKEFYDGLRDKIVTITVKVQYGEEVDNITSEKKDQLDNLQNQIEHLRKCIKKERQLNRKIDMQMKLKKLKDELSNKLNNKHT
ncbi:DUF4391 domain-containing protein (plasmid) [Ligilactobacillus salivarius]|uniref:DUF4391 domain-containing protein n=1 Tax=Ligilactobacillus salivarius TaxID=1624 RepID=UPI003C2B6F35